MASASTSNQNDEIDSNGTQTNDEDKNNNKNECSQCGATFKHPSSLSRHKKKHQNNNTSAADDDDSYTCQTCFKTFERKDNLLKHLKNVACQPPSIKETEWKCPTCLKVFNRKSNHTRHVQLHDKENNKLICTVDGCGRVYTRPDKLAEHVKSHSTGGSVKVKVSIPKRIKGKFRKRLFEMDNAADIALATSDNFDLFGGSILEDTDESFSLSMAVDSTSSTTMLRDITPSQFDTSGEYDLDDHSNLTPSSNIPDYLSSTIDITTQEHEYFEVR